MIPSGLIKKHLKTPQGTQWVSLKTTESLVKDGVSGQDWLDCV